MNAQPNRPPKRTPIKVYLTSKVHERVKAEAEKTGESVSRVAERHIIAGVGRG